MTESNPNDAWRVFVAIEIPATVREELREHIERLRAAVPQAHASWTRPENIHLTLKFLGDTARSRIDQLTEAVSRAVESSLPFTISVAGSGVFPNRRAPRVLWIGLRDDEQNLNQLHARLEEKCEDLGFQKEERVFRPHLTLARLRTPQHARALAQEHEQMDFEPVEFLVSEVFVIRSELLSAGSRYTILSKHPLGE